MIDRDEKQVGRILSCLTATRRAKGRLADCSEEETLASYLSGLLAHSAREEFEAHLAVCTACLDDVTAAHAAVPGGEKEAVSRRLLERAMALVPAAPAAPDLFNLVVGLVRNSLELVSTSGELVPAPAPVGVRGKGKLADAAILQVEKELGEFKLAVEVERVEDEMCQVAVRVKTKAGLSSDGVRLSLLSGGREQASYLARDGGAIFERIPPGDYQLAMTQGGDPLGSVRLTIKEGRHGR